MSKIFNEFNYYINPQIKHDKPIKTKSDKKKKITSDKELSFDDMFADEELKIDTKAFKEQDNVVENYLKEIGIQGEKLKKTRNFYDLERYKKLIKEFISFAVDLIEKKESKTLWDKNKKQKISKVHITVINEELQELTKIFINEQQNVLAIAAKIDKIEGLLVNLLS